MTEIENLNQQQAAHVQQVDIQERQFALVERRLHELNVSVKAREDNLEDTISSIQTKATKDLDEALRDYRTSLSDRERAIVTQELALAQDQTRLRDDQAHVDAVSTRLHSSQAKLQDLEHEHQILVDAKQNTTHELRQTQDRVSQLKDMLEASETREHDLRSTGRTLDETNRRLQVSIQEQQHQLSVIAAHLQYPNEHNAQAHPVHASQPILTLVQNQHQDWLEQEQAWAKERQELREALDRAQLESQRVRHELEDERIEMDGLRQEIKGLEDMLKQAQNALVARAGSSMSSSVSRAHVLPFNGYNRLVSPTHSLRSSCSNHAGVVPPLSPLPTTTTHHHHHSSSSALQEVLPSTDVVSSGLYVSMLENQQQASSMLQAQQQQYEHQIQRLRQEMELNQNRERSEWQQKFLEFEKVKQDEKPPVPIRHTLDRNPTMTSIEKERDRSTRLAPVEQNQRQDAEQKEVELVEQENTTRSTKEEEALGSCVEALPATSVSGSAELHTATAVRNDSPVASTSATRAVPLTPDDPTLFKPSTESMGLIHDTIFEESSTPESLVTNTVVVSEDQTTVAEEQEDEAQDNSEGKATPFVEDTAEDQRQEEVEDPSEDTAEDQEEGEDPSEDTAEDQEEVDEDTAVIEKYRQRAMERRAEQQQQSSSSFSLGLESSVSSSQESEERPSEALVSDTSQSDEELSVHEFR